MKIVFVETEDDEQPFLPKVWRGTMSRSSTRSAMSPGDAEIVPVFVNSHVGSEFLPRHPKVTLPRGQKRRAQPGRQIARQGVARQDARLAARVGFRHVPLDKLLRTSDTVTLHAPLNNRTRATAGCSPMRTFSSPRIPGSAVSRLSSASVWETCRSSATFPMGDSSRRQS